MQALRVFLLVVVFVLMALASGCAHRVVGGKTWRPEYRITRETLSNGLTVLYIEDRTAPVVSYVTRFRVGSAWEKPGSTGIAHLFEHMMFKGTPRFPAQRFFEQLEGKGAIVNAFTERDSTVYYEVIASGHLEMVIDIESDRLKNLMITQADLDSERQVVKEERRLRVDSNFAAQQMEELQKLAFPTHPYGWPVIGYQEDLNRLTLDECKKFFETHYQPGNALVTIAGDFDTAQVAKWVRKYYEPIPGRQITALTLAPEKPKPGEKRLVINKPVEAESILIGYYVPSMYSPDAEKLSMLSWALFGMSSSRAVLELVRQKQLVLSISADASLGRFPYLFLVSAAVKTGQTTLAAEQEIYRLVDEAKEKLLSEAELDRVKNGLLYATFNESKSVLGIANWLASGEFDWNDYRKVFEKLERYYEMKPADLREVAQRYLNKENRVVVIMKPAKTPKRNL